MSFHPIPREFASHQGGGRRRFLTLAGALVWALVAVVVLAVSPLHLASPAAQNSRIGVPQVPVGLQRVTPDGHEPFTGLTDRIQLDTWSDLRLGIVDDPMTEIVKIRSATGRATGTFLAECRIITAAHVIVGLEHAGRRLVLAPGESLIGKTYTFDTQGLPPAGRPVTGRMIVLGHGDYHEGDWEQQGMHDWAIGYDDQCLSETLELGHVRLVPGQSFQRMAGVPFFSAGHAGVPAANRAGSYHLLVDSRCTVTEEGSRNNFSSFFATNCASGPGGSGSLLFAPVLLNGRPLVGINGRVQKQAVGMFQAAASRGTERSLTDPDGSAIGLTAFTNEFYWKRLAPFLVGPVDVTALLARGTDPPPYCNAFLELAKEGHELPNFKTRRAVPGPPTYTGAAVGMPDPTSCEFLGTAARFTCKWSRLVEAPLLFEKLSSTVKACFPSYETSAYSEIGDSSVSVVIPFGTFGGPSYLRVRLDRGELRMFVEPWVR